MKAETLDKMIWELRFRKASVPFNRAVRDFVEKLFAELLREAQEAGFYGEQPDIEKILSIEEPTPESRDASAKQLGAIIYDMNKRRYECEE